MKKILSLFLFFFIGFQGFAQSNDFLLLKRGSNQKTQIRYYVGEEITYKSKKIGFFVTDVITGFEDDFIYLRENIISPEDILEIDIRRKDKRNGRLTALNSLVLGAGVILISVEVINSLYQTGSVDVDDGVGLTSAILVGTGLAMLPLRYKTFKVKGNNRIQIVLMRMD